MALTGLLNSIITSAERINDGRYGIKTAGKEQEGRLSYEKGIAEASKAFSQAASTADPQVILLAEETFVEQELQFCSEEDIHTRSSLTQVLQSFEDAFLCLKAVEDISGYKTADNTWPHNQKYRIHDFPKDAFHLACISHRTRLLNVLRTPGMNMIEKVVFQQRIDNMSVAQGSYIQMQKKVFAN